MLILDGTSDKIQLVTDAAGDIEAHYSYLENNAGTITPVSEALASITSATTTDIVGSPAASRQFNVKHLNFRNNHASQTVVCTVQHIDGTDTVSLMKVTLLAGETLVLNAAGTWIHYDVNGGMYPQVGAIAAQADMEAGTSNVMAVSPLGVNWHPGVAKAWAKHLVSAGVPQMTVSWNVTSVTDSAVCRVAPVIATDFSSANYAILYGFECNTTTYSATTVACIQTIRNGTQAAGGFTMDLIEIDIGQTTDPSAWHWVAFGDQ